MDPAISQNQTSFIPRKAVGRESSIREKPVGIFLIISTFVFVVAILASGFFYLWKFSLNRNITKAGQYLEERKSALEPTTINELLKTDKRLRAAADLLSNHLVASPIFSLLEDQTLKSVRFTRFEYNNEPGKGVTLKLSGEARSYGSVALQADTLNADKQYVKSAVFSNLNLDDKGNVTFDALVALDPDATNYKKSLDRAAGGAPAFPAQ